MADNIVQVTPNLWVAQSRLFQMNAGVWLSDGQAALVDPGIYPDEIDAIASFVEAQGATPTLILLTHSHWDHVLGPERFPGVPVLAYHDFTHWVHSRRARVVETITNFYTKAKIERDTPFAPPVPNTTFEHETTIQVGQSALRLIHGPGHAPDQLTIYHATSGTLWAADMLSDIEIPFVIHNWADFQRTLDGLAQLEIKTLVPGHGSPTSDSTEIRTRLTADIAYLRDIRAQAEAFIRDGKSIDDLVAACADWPMRLPKDNAGSHKINVE